MDDGGDGNSPIRDAHGTPAVDQDTELILAFQNGSEDAFNRIVRKYKDPLMNFVYRFLGDYDEADDVVQETFIRLARNKSYYKPVAKFSTWLYTIAANLARTQLRRRKRQALFSLNSFRRGEDASQFEIPDSRYSADAMAEGTLRSKLITEALEKIPPKYRKVVLLCDVQELSYEEIAEIVGANIGTVKSRLNRGRTQLQILLKDLINE